MATQTCSRGRPLETISKRALFCLKVGLSVNIFFLSFSAGFFSTLNGPSLPDLRVRYESTVEGMSASLGLKNIGLLIGSLIGGIMNDRFLNKANLIMAAALIICGVCTLLIPFGTQLWVLSLLSFFQGFGHGFSTPSSLATVTTLWGKRSAMPLHAVLFGWPLAQVLVPLIVRPFLSQKKEDPPGCNITMNVTTECPLMASTEGTDDWAPIEIPYLMGALVCFVTAAALVILFFFIPKEILTMQKKPKKSVKAMFHPGSCSGGRPVYGVVLVTLFTLYVIFNSGIGRISNLLYSYLLDSDLDFNRDEAVMFQLGMNLASMLARIGASFILLKVPIQVLTFIEAFGTLACCLCVIFLGTWNKTMLWVFTIASSAFTGPMFPGQYAWIDRYIILYSLVVSIAACGTGLMGYFFEWLNGYLYTNVSRDGILYSRMGCSAACAVLIVIMQILASYHGERDRTVNDEDGKKQMEEEGDSQTTDPPPYTASEKELQSYNSAFVMDTNVNKIQKTDDSKPQPFLNVTL